MHKIKLSGSDLNVSKICLGTMTFGQQNNEHEAHEQLDYALAHDINFIDTAEMYPVPPRAETCFSTEQIVGNWLTKQNRAELVIASKAAGPGRGMEWIRNGKHAFNAENLTAAVDNSLKRLQTDYIDLYQLHWPERNTPMFGEFLFDPDREHDFTPFHETLNALDQLIKAGKIRYVGLSNEWPWGLMQFLLCAKEYNLPTMISVQNAYNLINRTFETSMLECCYREDISLLAYSPMAFGILSGKYHMDPNAKGRVTEFKGFAQRYQKPRVPDAVAAYVNLAERYHLTPAQLALAFVYSRWFVTSTIIGATNMIQLKENIDAASIEVTPEIEEELKVLHLQYFNPAP